MIYDNGKMGLCDKENGGIFLPLEYDSLFVDYFWLVPDKPIRIVTYKNNIINILDEKGNILQSNIQETELKEKYNIDIDHFYTLPCSYESLLMLHNRTFQPPSCLLDIFKKHDEPVDLIYYKMNEDQ